MNSSLFGPAGTDEGLLMKIDTFRPANLTQDMKPATVLGSIADPPKWWHDRFQVHFHIQLADSSICYPGATDWQLWWPPSPPGGWFLFLRYQA